MQYKFFPHTEEDVKQMLSRIGIGSLDDLYKEVPEEIRFRRNYHLPEAMSEQEIRNFFRELGSKNQQLRRWRLRPLHPLDHPTSRGTIGVSHQLYTLSGGDFARNVALHLRVSKHDGRTNGNADLKCVNV